MHSALSRFSPQGSEPLFAYIAAFRAVKSVLRAEYRVKPDLHSSPDLSPMQGSRTRPLSESAQA